MHSTMGHRMGHAYHVRQQVPIRLLKPRLALTTLPGISCLMAGAFTPRLPRARSVERGRCNISRVCVSCWAFPFFPALHVVGYDCKPRKSHSSILTRILGLAKVGREAQAIQTLADIQAGGNQRDPLVLAEWNEICTVLEAERAGASKGWHRFYRNGMWKRTLAGCSAQAWQQLTGANVCPKFL